MSKGRPKKPPEERKVITCVRVKPSTLRWYKNHKISMGKTLEEYKERNMKAPDKIYVNITHPISEEYTEMIAFEDDGDIEYIRKDALLEWAKEEQMKSTTILADDWWQKIIDKINEL